MITPYKIITTSWDDGHPLDFKIAELLEKYGLKGTFYVPKHNHQNKVMHDAELLQLQKKFELGGHTINHVNLNKLHSGEQQKEIADCYNWLANLTGVKPQSFCPPFGAYNKRSLEIILNSGFRTIRTTQLLTAAPANAHINHTTLQLFKHSSFTYAKHLLVRGRFSDFNFWLSNGAGNDLLTLTKIYLNHIDEFGGCFHLWGHSWEIDKYNLWKELENVISYLSNRPDYHYFTNGQLTKTQ